MLLAMNRKSLKFILLLLLLAGEVRGPQPVSLEATYPPLLAYNRTNLLCAPWPDSLLHQRLHCGTTFLVAVCIMVLGATLRAADLGMPVDEVLLNIYLRHQDRIR